MLVGHYNDVGGRVPGSSAADSTEIYQEGLRIPVLKLYERGRANETLLELIRINVRIPDVVLGDGKRSAKPWTGVDVSVCSG